jgi:hypothetical protein
MMYPQEIEVGDWVGWLIRALDLGFSKPITFLSGLLMRRTLAHNFVKSAAHLSHAFSRFLIYLLYELL